MLCLKVNRKKLAEVLLFFLISVVVVAVVALFRNCLWRLKM